MNIYLRSNRHWPFLSHDFNIEIDDVQKEVHGDACTSLDPGQIRIAQRPEENQSRA